MSSLHYVFLFIGLVAASLRNVRAITKEEISALESAMHPFVLDCGKEFGVDEEEIKKAKESGTAYSLDPCLFACFGKKIGLINDKGEFDTEKATEITKKFIVDEEVQNKILEVIEKCSSVNEQSVDNDKGCERAALLVKCFEPLKEQALTEEEISAVESVMHPFVLDCGKEFGVDEEELIKAKESGTTDSLDPCLLACFGKKIGLINDKEMFDTEKATEMTKQYIVDEEAQKKVMEFVNKCSSVNEQSLGDDKGCERAALLAKCFKPLKDQLAAL